MTSPVLVTGGTGRLGRSVVTRLIKAGQDVRVLARRQRDMHPQVTFFAGDLRRDEGIDPAVRGAGLIIHCATSTKGGNLAAERASLKARVRKVEARLAVQAGEKQGRTRGYATPAERHSKALRLKALKARLAHVERRLDAGAVPVTRGGKNLLRKRNNLAGAGLTEAQWREEWEATGCS